MLSKAESFHRRNVEIYQAKEENPSLSHDLTSIFRTR